MTDGTLKLADKGLEVGTLRIEVLSGPSRGHVHHTKSDTVSIGSDPSNELVIDDPTVSRFHADLTREGSRILLEDQGSTNGTKVGSTVIQRGSIAPGSIIELGKTSLRVDTGDPVTLALHEQESLGPLLGRSAIMRKLMSTVARIARTDGTVLITGETGSGKEVVARAIHECSPRADRPFETVDCGAILPTLLASELFGHEKGAFTGAETQHIGAFERADGGTLFLDEIGELPSALQVALLGALERRAFRRVGGKDSIAVDVRVISATNRDLRREVNASGFRADLYYRLAVIVLVVPSLRDRPEDIPLLAAHFLRKAGFPGSPESFLTDSVVKSLRDHYWPGNVRELRNLIEATVAFGEVPQLESQALPRSASIGGREAMSPSIESFVHEPYNAARAALLDRFEDLYIRALLERTEGNVSRAAREAGMNRSYLTKMLKRRGIRFQRSPVDDES